MKILYATQATGNGHIARANVLVPLLRQHQEVDVFISGQNAQLALDFDFKSHPGISLFYSCKGGLDYKKIIQKNSFVQFVKALRAFPIHNYDLIVNDFEPVTAYAARLHHHRILGVSHQAAVLHKLAPKPTKRHKLGQAIMKNYAPVEDAMGFHFKKYDDRIFHPILRNSIRNLKTHEKGHYLVYLPSFLDQHLIQALRQLQGAEWIVFSPFTKNPWKASNCTFLPIDQVRFAEYLAGAKGILCGAGFEFPAEVLYLKKMLYVIPIKGQFEQFCNYLALRELGVYGSENLDIENIKTWLQEGRIVDIEFQDDTDKVIEQILQIAES